MTKIGGVDAYVAKPKPGRNNNGCGVLLLHDAFGYNLPNTQLVADAMAEVGDFLVVVPDLFDGKPLHPSLLERMLPLMGYGQSKPTSWFQSLQQSLYKAVLLAQLSYYFVPFLITQGRCSGKMPLIDAVLTDMNAQHGIKKVAAIGFCYGGSGCLALGKLPDKIEAFAVAHGEVHVPADIEPLKKPGLFLSADDDWSFPKSAFEEAKAILGKRPDASNYEMKYYPGTFHGFAIRGDDKDEVVKEAKDDAIQTAISFFRKH
ncbi:hypothetical protein WJX72_011803 [[Myrmecia] bisecta]|uniref:Dienelactone hydrolase domain-containing protein n=1 Tax=[Myrmecia] bisecta TaxID=41462 RepID=A0AAW1Q1A2_9CHLO